MCTTDYIHKRPNSLQTTFITDPFITVHFHNKPRSLQTTFITDRIHNRLVLYSSRS